MTANEITAKLLIELPKRYDCLCWRNNTGSGIGWGQVKKAIGILRRATAGTWRDCIDAAIKCLRRPIDFGLVGSADILCVMSKPHKFIGLEIKNPETGDEQSISQQAWELRVVAVGGAYLIVESVEQGLKDLEALL